MRRGVVALGISVVVLAMIGCAPAGDGGGTDAPAPPTQAAAACVVSSDAPGATVRIIDFAFEPNSVDTKIGQPIEWSNEDGAPHAVALDAGSCTTGNLAAGTGAGSLVFAEPGEYAYHCSIHSSMKGTIVVTN